MQKETVLDQEKSARFQGSVRELVAGKFDLTHFDDLNC